MSCMVTSSTSDATVDDPVERPRLARQVEAQVQSVQVLEGAYGHRADGPHRHLRCDSGCPTPVCLVTSAALVLCARFDLQILQREVPACTIGSSTWLPHRSYCIV